MVATGIVRRIDDLGRIVIPKEIRRNLRLCEGDPMEIFMDESGYLIFRKYEIVFQPLDPRPLEDLLNNYNEYLSEEEVSFFLETIKGFEAYNKRIKEKE